MLDILLNIITFLHVLLVIFVVITPFLNSNYFLFLHVIFIPFLVLHWICNDNTCVLTIIERELRKKIHNKDDVDDECITCKLIEPVYDFRKNYQTFTVLIYGITLSLWLISVSRLTYKYHEAQITNYKDLFII